MNTANRATSFIGESQVLDLPTEIQVRILSELPAKEVQSCRRVCKHIRDIIDEQSNATLLFGATQARERSRLSQDLADATDFTNVDFFDALARWLKRRGLWVDEEPQHIVALTFVIHWWEQQGLVTELPDDEESQDEMHRHLMWLAQALISLSTNLHVDVVVASVFRDPIDGGDIVDVGDLVQCALYTLPGSVRSLERCGIDDLKIWQWGKKIENSSSCLSAPVASAIPLPSALRRPVWNLTSSCRLQVAESFDEGGAGEDDEDGSGIVEGIVEHEWLAQALEIDRIPSSCSTVFTYCSRTEWAYNKLRFCKEGGNMSELEKTAILEDVFLF